MLLFNQAARSLRSLTSNMSCCPPGSKGFLASDYQYTGTKIESNSFHFYSVDSSKPTTNGIIIFSDVWGWDSGRVRAIADLIADAGYHVLVPKILVNSLRGGVDGDGLPNDFDFGKNGKEFPGFIKQHPWNEVVKPIAAEATSILQSKGVTKAGAVGFCYGGWNVINALTDPATSLVCYGAIAHPSITNINGILNPTQPVEEFVGSVRGPVILLPAGNDPKDYRPGGNVFETLKAKQPDSATFQEFEDVNHGFAVRGDFSEGSKDLAAANKAHERFLEFFAAQSAK